jgi:hypothetical protein
MHVTRCANSGCRRGVPRANLLCGRCFDSLPDEIARALHLADSLDGRGSQSYQAALALACGALAVVVHTIDQHGVVHPRPKGPKGVKSC